MPPKTRKKMVFWSQYDKLIEANLPARENSYKKKFHLLSHRTMMLSRGKAINNSQAHFPFCAREREKW